MGPYKPLRTWVDEFIPYYMEIMGPLRTEALAYLFVTLPWPPAFYYGSCAECWPHLFQDERKESTTVCRMPILSIVRVEASCFHYGDVQPTVWTFS